MNSIALVVSSDSKECFESIRVLIKKGIDLSYVVICTNNNLDLANTVYAIDNHLLLKDIKKLQCNIFDINLRKVLKKTDVPYFYIDDQNSETLCRILNQYPIDVLFVSNGSIIYSALYIPRLFVLSTHTASLPTYMGDSAISFFLYHNYTTKVSLYVMQPNLNISPILGEKEYCIDKENILEDIIKKAQIACTELITDTLYNIQNDNIPSLKYQKDWEHSSFVSVNNVTQPEMSNILKKDLRKNFLYLKS